MKAPKSIIGTTDLQPWHPPPPRTPGEKFMRSRPSDMEPGTPRPFIPQHRFHTDRPSSYIPNQGTIQKSAIKSERETKFQTPPIVKTPATDRK